MSKLIPCAIVGLGRIGSTLEKDELREKPASHAGVISHHPRTILVAGSDPNPERRREFAESWPQARVYENFQDMIVEESPRILHIAAWTSAHIELLEEALTHHIPVVICEKPLAESTEAAQRIMARAQRSSTRIVINHERRFSGDYRAVRRAVTKKDYGTLLGISARLHMGRKRKAEQVLLHDGTHMLDILRYLTGKELTVNHAEGRGNGKGLNVLMSAGSTVLQLDVSGGRDYLVFELDLSFTSGRIRIGNGTFEVWKSEASPHYSGFRSLKRIRSEWPGNTEYFAGMMNHAVRLHRHPRLRNESSLKDGYAALAAIETILGWKNP